MRSIVGGVVGISWSKSGSKELKRLKTVEPISPSQCSMDALDDLLAGVSGMDVTGVL